MQLTSDAIAGLTQLLSARVRLVITLSFTTHTLANILALLYAT